MVCNRGPKKGEITTHSTTPNYCHTYTEDHTLPVNDTNRDHA
jgi:hypothetical protein